LDFDKDVDGIRGIKTTAINARDRSVCSDYGTKNQLLIDLWTYKNCFQSNLDKKMRQGKERTEKHKELDKAS
jgi:hypothetical protein